MDIKQKIEEVFGKVKNDPDFGKAFASDPVKAVESVMGIDLPDDQINSLIDSVKQKLATDQGKDVLGNINKLL